MQVHQVHAMWPICNDASSSVCQRANSIAAYAHPNNGKNGPCWGPRWAVGQPIWKIGCIALLTRNEVRAQAKSFVFRSCKGTVGDVLWNESEYLWHRPARFGTGGRSVETAMGFHHVEAISI